MTQGHPHRLRGDSGAPDPSHAARLADANAHLAAGRWSAACARFLELAVEPPQRRDYRARMHYARGRDYLAVRQYRHARAELRRAIELDPTLTVAADALVQATTLLSRLFRR